MSKTFSLMVCCILGVLVLLISGGFKTASAQDMPSKERQIIWGEGPSNLLKMDERIDQQAQMLQDEVREVGGVKRVAFFDIAFPNGMLYLTYP